ncbi:glycosyltransferase family 2 protein [Proteiniclasticum sp. QWL-01]|uniref:glycosyltransferase family 2 protein n=1 Tax=Proteiniclasticum sp. QWL-01 TaxID=3036945 RepID=UPI00220C1366|nr:glycosyltransferase family 2 protein [Proteiniclasticum sp. QWL-01]UUM12956.1 glycosyltransferase family 2 protein [Clostridiaceae bacterium HFYG-1003]WFF74501.1 glycosyltransferase family 2 protein [Proteiniclasticum sp. QWL-01]
MEFLGRAFISLMHIINYLAVAVSSYYIFLTLFSLYQKKRKQLEDGNRRFAVVIAAHNESQVIRQSVESCLRMDYPKELFDVYVIADNCNDNTKEIASQAGAAVFERFNKTEVGKGYALQWFFDQLLKMNKGYRTCVILDADNLVHPSFLKEMNKKMNQGYKVVQGYLDSKNPDDTYLTGCISMEFWISNRMLKLSRDNLGLSAQLGGTGFAVDTDILEHYGWDATCLTEDLEFTCKLCLNGYKVGWAHEAIIYDEKPLTMAASWRQRKRWMQGFADVFTQYFFPLMNKGIRTGSMIMIDCAFYSIQPILLIIFGISAGYGILYNLYYLQDTIRQMALLNLGRILSLKEMLYAAGQILQLLLIPFILWLDKKLSLRNLMYYALLPLYIPTWMPIAILGILHKNRKEWDHTEHVRAIHIDQIDKV